MLTPALWKLHDIQIADCYVGYGEYLTKEQSLLFLGRILRAISFSSFLSPSNSPLLFKFHMFFYCHNMLHNV